MKRLPFSLLLLLASCGSSGYSPLTYCKLSDNLLINLETYDSCSCAEEKLRGAWKMLVAKELIPPDAPFFSGAVWVHAESDDLMEKDGRIGLYVPNWRGGPRIHVTNNMEALAHELLHYYEVERLGVSEQDSSHHVGWDEKKGWESYNGATNHFRNLVNTGYYCSP